jgi:hypothetical protein
MLQLSFIFYTFLNQDLFCSLNIHFYINLCLDYYFNYFKLSYFVKFIN